MREWFGFSHSVIHLFKSCRAGFLLTAQTLDNKPDGNGSPSFFCEAIVYSRADYFAYTYFHFLKFSWQLILND